MSPPEVLKDPSAVMNIIDCRVYRKLIHVTSLKSATVFMNAESDEDVESQVNALHRVRDMYRLHQFKPASYKTVAEQKEVSALTEARKFGKLLESEKMAFRNGKRISIGPSPHNEVRCRGSDQHW